MPWPDWKQAGVATVVLLVAAAGCRRTGRVRLLRFGRAGQETALVCFLYMVWRLARQLPLVRDAGAEQRGRQILRLEHALHLPSELAMSRWVLDHRWAAEANSAFYATAHVPALIAFLVWLYVRHRPHYGRWRNALAITTGFCLFIRFLRVAPPRLLPDLGFVDVSAALHQSVYGPTGTGVSDQYAAMPSIHVAWASIVAFGAWQASRSRWRWWGMAHLAATYSAVVTTANHWWLDGIVATVLVGFALVLDDAGRRILGRLRLDRSSSTDPTAGQADEADDRKGDDGRTQDPPPRVGASYQLVAGPPDQGETSREA